MMACGILMEQETTLFGIPGVSGVGTMSENQTVLGAVLNHILFLWIQDIP